VPGHIATCGFHFIHVCDDSVVSCSARSALRRASACIATSTKPSTTTCARSGGLNSTNQLDIEERRKPTQREYFLPFVRPRACKNLPESIDSSQARVVRSCCSLTVGSAKGRARPDVNLHKLFFAIKTSPEIKNFHRVLLPSSQRAPPRLFH
jgi:hypothetical protein